MKLLDEYFELQKKIHAYFGYVEDWRVLPLADATMYYWREDGKNVTFADTDEQLDSDRGDYYENEIYTQRHLPKWVYRGEKYTMIVVDTHTDGNQLLQVFDNSLERR